MKYTVTIEERVSQSFEVSASSADEALDIAIDKYHAAEFVVESGNVTARLIQVSTPEDDVTEWSEF